MSSKTTHATAKRDGSRDFTPELRFPEFHEAGAWETVRLGSVASVSTRKAGEKACVPMSITSGVGLVSQIEKFGRIIAGDSYKNYLLLEKNDFAYNKSATKEYPEGFIALYTGEELAAVPNSIFTCFRVNGGAISQKYLNHLFLGNLHGRWLRKFIEVGARAHGSLSIDDLDLLALPVPIPSGPLSLQEQEKIASCLDSMDARIAEQEQKVEALRVHKKGLMQQLFPKDGETQPRYRFPEFRSVGRWKEKPLYTLCDIKHGYAFEGEFFAKEGEYVLLTPGNFNELGGYRDQGPKQKYYTGPIPPGYVLSQGDLLVAMTEQAKGLLGSPILVPESNRFLHNQRLGLVTSRAGAEWTNKFFFHFFNTDAVRNAIEASASGAKVRHTSPTKIGEVVGSYPTSVAEQERIADCLTSLDNLIAAEVQKLVLFRTHKRALMQQLFPAIEETES